MVFFVLFWDLDWFFVLFGLCCGSFEFLRGGRFCFFWVWLVAWREMGASGYLPIVVVHGGAWNIPEKLLDGSEEGARRAATAGMESLRKSPNDALAAVEAAVKVLEDDPVFDAGTGSCLTADRSVEMDAILMDGSTLKTGNHSCTLELFVGVHCASSEGTL